MKTADQILEGLFPNRMFSFTKEEVLEAMRSHSRQSTASLSQELEEAKRENEGLKGELDAAYLKGFRDARPDEM